MLTRYWITFERPEGSPPLGGVFGFGVGVTAYCLGDAKKIIMENIFKGEIPPIKEVIENIKYDDLEENHVRMNMGVMVNRGIWFPKGFDYYR